MKSVLFAFSLLVIITLCSSDVDDLNKKKQEILDKLLENYDNRVRPKGSGPTTVKVSIHVLDVYDMDEYLKDFTMQCYFRQIWRDPRLAFGNETKIRKIRSAEVDRIWKPDLFFVNEIRGEQHDLMVPNHFLHIENEGDIRLSTRVTVILSCHTNLEYYPHDEQKCYMQIESYGFPHDELSLNWDGDSAVSFSEHLTSDSKFILSDHDMKVATETVNETKYSRLKLELHFARNAHAFLISVYLPHIFLVILSWAAFCFDHKNVTLRLIYLGLIMFLMLRLVPIEKHPDLHITALDIWVAVCVMFILSSFIESIFVNQLANEEQNQKMKDQDAEQQALNSGNMNEEKMDKKSENPKTSKMLARLARKYPDHSKRVDVICRVVSPILFLLFNIIYWSVCCSSWNAD